MVAARRFWFDSSAPEVQVPKYLAGKAVFVIGTGSEAHRGVAIGLAEQGADVAVGGITGDLAAEAQLHSIANEVWAIGRKSTVVTIDGTGSSAFAVAVAGVMDELKPSELLIVRCEAVANA
jgi:NAD(P)-dependent dehydrogenase (short-subunit alcohol dehydrogenase family)